MRRSTTRWSKRRTKRAPLFAWQAEAGFDRIKVYSNLTRPAYEAIIEEAAARDMPVAGHTPEGVREDGMPDDKAVRHFFRGSPGRSFRDDRAYRVCRLARPAQPP
jgi:hypothetical protein